MRLNRSGYYKWRERRGKKNLREKRREEITGKLKQAHKKYPSHGYHRLARDIKDKLDYSTSLLQKCRNIFKGKKVAAGSRKCKISELNKR